MNLWKQKFSINTYVYTLQIEVNSLVILLQHFITSWDIHTLVNNPSSYQSGKFDTAIMGYWIHTSSKVCLSRTVYRSHLTAFQLQIKTGALAYVVYYKRVRQFIINFTVTILSDIFIHWGKQDVLISQDIRAWTSQCIK